MEIKKFIIQVCLTASLWTTFAHPNEFLSTPPEKFTLDPKNIALHHPVQTEKLAAQLYFDQGLTQLYAFNNDTAYWSFLNASKIDPQMSMAYWGMAISLFPEFQMPMAQEAKKAAQEAIQKAIILAKNGSEIERAYIDALSKKFTDNSDNDNNNVQYSQSLQRLSNKYPDDPDAAVLWAASLLDLQKDSWNQEGKPLPGTQEAVDILETVMKKLPNHVGANHYYIHVMDGSPFPEKALRSAERLKTLLPNSGHLLHMPSHIYLLVGEYHQAALCSENALAADQQYINTYGIEGSYPRNYVTHSLYFLTRIYILEERSEDAKRTAEKLRQFYLRHSKHMPEMEYYAVIPLFTFIHFHEWRKILEFPKSSEEMPLANLFWHFSRAVAFAHLKNSPDSLKESQSFAEAKKRLMENADTQKETHKKMISILENCMNAAIAENEGRTAEAIKFLREAISEQNSVPYNESPITFFSARQQLGALLLKLGQTKEAEQIYRDDLNRIPNNCRSLFGLKESLNAQSKFYDLYWVDQAFQEAFKYSDIDLTQDNL